MSASQFWSIRDIVDILSNPDKYEWRRDRTFESRRNTPRRTYVMKSRNNFTYLSAGLAEGLSALDKQRQRRNEKMLANRTFLGEKKHRTHSPWARPSGRLLHAVTPTVAALIRKRLWDQTLIGNKNVICSNRSGRFYVTSIPGGDVKTRATE